MLDQAVRLLAITETKGKIEATYKPLDFDGILAAGEIPQ